MAEYFAGRSRENMDTNKRNFLTAMIPVALGMPFAVFSEGRLLNAEISGQPHRRAQEGHRYTTRCLTTRPLPSPKIF